MDIKEQLIASLSSLDSEHAVIGGLLINNDAIDQCQTLTHTMFFNRVHGLIYKAIGSLLTEHKPADVVTVAERLNQMGHGHEFGGISYLAEIQRHTPSAANMRRYVDIVRTRNAERQMLLASDVIAGLATERDGRSLCDRQAEAMQLLETICDNAASGERELTAGEAMLACIRDIQQRIDRKDGELGGLPTGLNELDEMLDGLRAGELIVIGGRPSMGKSVLAENIARLNLKRGAAVRVQSYEMPGKDWMARSAAAENSIPLENIRRARMTEDEYLRFSAFVGTSSDWRLTIDEDAAPVEKICARARAQKRRAGLDLLVIDHLHLMPKPGKNEVKEIGDITGALKRLALELQVPVLLLSQLNRAGASGVVRAPNLADLRSSGTIEQDADVVIFPHRPGYYDDTIHLGIAELHVSKHRNGPVGKINLGWRGDMVRFQNKVPHDWNPPRSKAAHQNDDEEI